MYKIIVVPDVHGTEHWKNFAIPYFDKICFLGDYVDSYTIPKKQIYKNLQNIINFKLKHKDKVELLLGNHDLQYMHYPNPQFTCSGFNHSMAQQYSALFKEHASLFKVAYQHKNILFTHAGLSKHFFDKHIANVWDPKDHNLGEALNILYEKKYDPLFYVGFARGGRKSHGGVFWADHSELIYDPVPDIFQVTGHNIVNTIETYEHIIFTDCLEHGKPQILTIYD